MWLDLRLQGAKLRFNGGPLGPLDVAPALRQFDPAEIDEQRDAARDQRENNGHHPNVALVHAVGGRWRGRNNFESDSPPMAPATISAK